MARYERRWKSKGKAVVLTNTYHLDMSNGPVIKSWGGVLQAPSVVSKISQIIADHRRSSAIIGQRWGYLGLLA
jgi:hypothetical protein